MSASDLTEKAIKETLFAMLRVMPFDRITVTELVRRCGISQSTFYYHFDDIESLLYQMLNEIFKEFNDEPIDGDWKNNVKGMMSMCRDNSDIVYNVFNSLSKEVIEQKLFGLTDDMIEKYIRSQAEGKGITEQRLEQIISICRYAYLGFFLRFLWTGMNDDIDRTVDEISILFYEAIDCFVNDN